MSRRFALTLTLVFSVLLMGIAPVVNAAPTAQAATTAMVRFVHAVPEAPAVDIVVNDALAASQLNYADYTHYLNLDGGEYAVKVLAAGATFIETSLAVQAGQVITVVVTGSVDAPEVVTFEDDLTPLVVGNVRLSALNVASGVDSVDVLLPDGSPVLQGLAFGAGSGGIDIPANVYPLAVAPSGAPVADAIRPAADYPLRGGMVYRLLVLGGEPGTLMLETAALASAESVQVRVTHAIADAPSVDVTANGTLLVPSLEPNKMTQHVALPLGTYDLAVVAVGETEPITALSVDLSDAALAGKAFTVAAIQDEAGPSLQVFEDNLGELAPDMARVSVMNAAVGSTLTAALSDGTVVASGLSFGNVESVDVAAANYEILIANESQSNLNGELDFNGGIVYSFLVTGSGDQLASALFRETALNTRPGSLVALPGEVVAVEAVPEATEEAQPTAEAEVTEAPTAAPLPQQTAAPTSITLGQVYNLNPGANLQMREYPRSDARSLGLVAAGTVLEVLGRAGEPDFTTPELAADEDLDPAQTWLSVRYTGADGSSITAWSIAQYITVTRKGQPWKLVDLEVLPSDVAGRSDGAAAPAAAPAPVEAEFYAVIYNLNDGVNLNIRRTPERTGEVLAAVQNGAIIEPTGILEDTSWMFVTYRPEEGGSVTGWVSSLYVQMVFRGKNFYTSNEDNILELLQRNLLTITEPTVRGRLGEGTNVAVPTVSPFYNKFVATTTQASNANLHLRRTPDAASESLALIPSGTEMIATGRNLVGDWVQVEYDNISGWVSGAFVTLSYNNHSAEIMQLPEVIQ